MNRLLATEHGINSIRSIISQITPSCSPPVDLDEILRENNIRLREHIIGLDIRGEQILGACKSEGLKRLIVVSPFVDNKQRRRFTIAHEIGHLFLHHGNRECIATDLQFWSDTRIKENEANAFAAELLLPYANIFATLKHSDISFDMIDNLAHKCDTSLTATAIRLVKADDGMSAAIYHDGTKVFWSVRSDTCRGDVESISINPMWRTKSDIHSPISKGIVDSEVWLTNECDDIECYEETRFFSRMKKYLTILNFIEL